MLILIMVFISGNYYDIMFFLGKVLSILVLAVILTDFYLLYLSGQRLALDRVLPEKLSNGDDNEILVIIKNDYYFNLKVRIIDEVPFQFQDRFFSIRVSINAREEKKVRYYLKPFERGSYEFGRIHVYAVSPIGIIIRRFTGKHKSETIKVYPSFLRMHKYQLLAINDRLIEIGITRIRRRGQHSEFDQIREYVPGDDRRTINWKAAARKNKLMVNQFQDERSQQVYSVIDMGRTMQMPFRHMSLLDYAINASLIISNTVIQKHDKAGILTYNTSVNAFLPAERKNNTILKILEILYDQHTSFSESNPELVYIILKNKVRHRSLLIFYTNFESLSGLNRQLEYLVKLSKLHLILIVVFENTEIMAMTEQFATTMEDIYMNTIAEKFMFEKKIIIKELNAHGIHSILTKPEDLTVNLINKYFELKYRGLI